MIDFRYKVIDADKATKWIKDAALMPHFENETSGVMLNHPGGMAHSPTLLPGRVYYMLYGNSGGALQPGDAVAVKFGDLSVGPWLRNKGRWMPPPSTTTGPLRMS